MFTKKATKTDFEKLHDTVNSLKKTVLELEQKLKLQEERLAAFEKIQIVKESDEPWVEVLGVTEDPEKGLKVSLDWNEAFINQLRSQGIHGLSESAIIAKWLVHLQRDILRNLSEEEQEEITSENSPHI